MTDHYRAALKTETGKIAYDILWRILFVLTYPLRPVARLILKAYDSTR